MALREPRFGRRRALWFLVGGVCFSACALPALPNQRGATTIARVGVLFSSTADSPAAAAILAGLKHGLTDLGYVEGHNLLLVVNRPTNPGDPVGPLADSLVQLPADVLVGASPVAVIALQQATRSIPIVMTTVADPVGLGLVASLSHPGGNLTGMTSGDQERSTYPKELELLVEIAPHTSRVAVLLDSSIPTNSVGLEQLRPAASALGVSLNPLEVHADEDVAPALDAARSWSADGLITFGGPAPLATMVPQIVDFANRLRIPTVVGTGENVRQGGLLSYGSSFVDQGQAAAIFVSKILHGANAADLPIEQPMVLHLTVNRTTAATLGLTIPDSVALQVTDWVN
jgi:putative ABC transport system substrate-binding protein